jgi:NADH:ubiquinone oxidoreductase subunit H
MSTILFILPFLVVDAISVPQLPRLRVDQFMTLGWKFLTPAALGLILGIGSWKIFIA